MSEDCDAKSPIVTIGYCIDPVRDRLLALRRVAEWYERRTGERIHRTSPYRWVLRGIAGLRLPSIRLGGARFTSEEAIAWWTTAIDSQGAAGPVASLLVSRPSEESAHG